MSVLEGTVAPPGMHAENAKLLFLLAGLALTRCLGAWVPDWLDRYRCQCCLACCPTWCVKGQHRHYPDDLTLCLTWCIEGQHGHPDDLASLPGLEYQGACCQAEVSACEFHQWIRRKECGFV